MLRLQHSHWAGLIETLGIGQTPSQFVSPHQVLLLLEVGPLGYGVLDIPLSSFGRISCLAA